MIRSKPAPPAKPVAAAKPVVAPAPRKATPAPPPARATVWRRYGGLAKSGQTEHCSQNGRVVAEAATKPTVVKTAEVAKSRETTAEAGREDALRLRKLLQRPSSLRRATAETARCAQTGCEGMLMPKNVANEKAPAPVKKEKQEACGEKKHANAAAKPAAEKEGP